MTSRAFLSGQWPCPPVRGCSPGLRKAGPQPWRKLWTLAKGLSPSERKIETEGAGALFSSVSDLFTSLHPAGFDVFNLPWVLYDVPFGRSVYHFLFFNIQIVLPFLTF